MTYRNILITGGTGTFGNAFTERMLTDNLAERVTIFSRDEKKQLDMRVKFNDARLRFYLGDVRDRWRLKRAFEGVDVVIHGAALKQVDRSAQDILEFIATNTIGTKNVLEAAHDADVGKVVVLSTDKACASATPYGATKSLAEWLAIGANVYGPTRSCAVRYGNVVGSRGSVLELWAGQAAQGNPLTITDDKMTRFWMPIRQAVDLVLLALERMGGGEIFIPKHVTKSRVIQFASMHFPGSEIQVTGEKRSYEKTHEWLVAPEEADRCHDCGDVYVLTPLHVRWSPGPYGLDFPLVERGFCHGSRGRQ